jgi:peptide/nickel transport system substrate-binding protein
MNPCDETRSKRKRIGLSLAAVCLVSGLSLVGCGSNPPSANQAGGTAPAGTATDPTTLTVAMPADEGTLDPAVTMDNAAWKITYPCYERLVKYDGDKTTVTYDLATSYTVSSDGKKYLFTLRDGDKFPDGTPVDANAVKFTFDRLMKINKGPAGDFEELQAVKVIDPTHVEFDLKYPFPAFVSALAANYASIVDPKVMEHEVNGDMGQSYLATHTMGSGPYQLAEWKKGQYLKLTVNPAYQGAKPKLQTVYFQIIGDASSERLQLEKGQVDIAEGIPADQLKSLSSESGITVVDKPSMLVDYMYLNVGKGNPALKDKRVRQAISYAIDYQGIIQSSQAGNATQMRGPIPQGLWGHDDNALQYSYQPDKAKALLQQAGVGHLTLTLLYSDHMPWWPSEALAIQSNLQQVGIEVKLQNVEYATERQMLDQGQFDLALGVWSPDYADPYMFMNFWFDSKNFGLAGNRAFYSNPQVDSLIRQAGSVSDQDQRTKLYQDAQKIVIDDAPYVYLYQKNYMLPMRTNVHGFVYNPMLEQIYNLAEMSKS